MNEIGNIEKRGAINFRTIINRFVMKPERIGEEEGEGRRERSGQRIEGGKKKKRVTSNNVTYNAYVSVRGRRRRKRMVHNSRQDKFIRYFRLDCAALGQKLRLELANRKPGPL